MKAVHLVRHGDPASAFEIREVAAPRPGPGELRIEVEAFGLNFADVLARLGQYPDAPPLPSVLGYEVVGRVDDLGTGLDGPEIGTRVVALTRFGGYATRVVTDARAVVPVPDSMDVGTAVALPTQGGTAWFCAEEMVTLHEGDHVLVQAAAGGVGTLLVQLCKRRGCVVYGTAGSEAKLELLRELGVDHPINYRTTDFAEAIARLRGDEGLDVVFDSLGGAAFRKGKRLLGPGGRIVAFGVSEQTGRSFRTLRTVKMAASFGFPHPVGLLMQSQGVLGVNMLRIADGRPLALRRCLQQMVRLALAGEVTPQVGARFEATQIAEAHALLEGRGSTGKIVLRWA